MRSPHVRIENLFLKSSHGVLGCKSVVFLHKKWILNKLSIIIIGSTPTFLYLDLNMKQSCVSLLRPSNRGTFTGGTFATCTQHLLRCKLQQFFARITSPLGLSCKVAFVSYVCFERT